MHFGSTISGEKNYKQTKSIRKFNWMAIVDD